MGSVLSVLSRRAKFVTGIALLVVYRWLRNRRAATAKLSFGAYDYIVVGAGTSGGIVAARLSENPNVKVLLLEAGGEANDYRINVPALGSLLQRDPKLDWMVETTPQANAMAALNNRVSFWPRGKVIGGTSCFNNMLYVRGNKANYDEWAEKYGCEGWSYDEVLPLFKKAEANSIPGLDPKYHGTDGPMTISIHDATNPCSHAFVQANVESGTPAGDINGENQFVAQLAPANVRGGVRDHVGQCYLTPEVRKRPNLDVITFAHCTRVVLDANNKVTGVAYKIIPYGTTRDQFNATPEQFVPAAREVIVSGGAVHSPQILMLSGIGPKRHLEEHGIECRQDLPMVGQNLQDHLFCSVSYSTSVDTLNNGKIFQLLANLARYAIWKKGQLQSTVVEAMSFHNTKVRADLAARGVPDLQIHMVPTSTPGAPKKGPNNFNLTDRYTDAFDFDNSTGDYREGWTSNGVTFLPTLLHPKSIGEVKLKTSSAFDNPLVDPHYLEHPDDVAVLREGLKYCTNVLAKTKAYADIIGYRRPPIENPHPVDSDEYWEHHIRESAITVYHPVGTVAMGSDPSIAALTPDLKVRGVKGLRVADASVMPVIPSANTHAPAIMIGEKCADMIKADWFKNHEGGSHARL